MLVKRASGIHCSYIRSCLDVFCALSTRLRAMPVVRRQPRTVKQTNMTKEVPPADPCSTSCLWWDPWVRLCKGTNKSEIYRADSRLAPSQKETSFWLGENLESALNIYVTFWTTPTNVFNKWIWRSQVNVLVYFGVPWDLTVLMKKWSS